MKLGIDISQIVHKGTGVSRYINGLANAILNNDKKNDWTFFFSSLRQTIDPQLKTKTLDRGINLIEYKLPPSLLSFLWNSCHWVNLERFVGKMDFFITSDWTEPPTKIIKKGTTVHDLSFIRYPETIEKRILNTQKKRLYWVKKESNLIFADSNATKQDLIEYLDFDENKINVVYPGVEVMEISKNDINQTHSKYKLTKPFILTVGKTEPRKNVKRLIEAFQQVNNKDVDLVIAGPKGWEQLNNRTIEQSNNIHVLGYVEDNDLFALYSSCLFFIYPSIWEGFGLPLIEAMKLGAPVTTSNIPPFKEIAKNAALLFNPLDTEDISQSIQTMINDEKIRKQLAEKGRSAVEIYSWENTYKNLINTIYAHCS